MDRFSKTTEIDTAEITAATMEDDTPKRSKATNIIALVLCLLIAVIVWIFVMETDTNYIEKSLDSVPVYGDYVDQSPIDHTTIVVKGIRKNVIDISANDLKLVALVDGGYDVYLTEEKGGRFIVELQFEPSNDIVVTVREK